MNAQSSEQPTFGSKAKLLKSAFASFFRQEKRETALDRMKQLDPVSLAKFEPLISAIKRKTKKKDMLRSIAAVNLIINDINSDLALPIALKLAEMKKGSDLADGICHLRMISNHNFSQNAVSFIDYIVDSVPGEKLCPVLQKMGDITLNMNFKRWMYVNLSLGFARGILAFKKFSSSDHNRLMEHPLNSINSFLSNPSFANEWFICENIARITSISMAVKANSNEKSAGASLSLFNRILMNEHLKMSYLELMDRYLAEKRYIGVKEFLEKFHGCSDELFSIRIRGSVF